jgi:chromosome segregation ATPase
MATVTSKPYCVKCEKERATTKCSGCSQDFCYNHLTDHRQELNQQLDHIEVNRDLFRQTLNEQTTNPTKHSFIKQIDQWENDSIKKIEQTAKECRQLILQYTKEHINQMEINLTKLTDQLRQTRKENDFNEIDLHQLKQKMTQLEEELDKFPHVFIQDDSTSFINKISVVVSSGKCLINYI